MIVVVNRNGQRVPCQTSADFWREFSKGMPTTGTAKQKPKGPQTAKGRRRF